MWGALSRATPAGAVRSPRTRSSIRRSATESMSRQPVTQSQRTRWLRRRHQASTWTLPWAASTHRVGKQSHRDVHWHSHQRNRRLEHSVGEYFQRCLHSNREGYSPARRSFEGPWVPRSREADGTQMSCRDSKRTLCIIRRCKQCRGTQLRSGACSSRLA